MGVASLVLGIVALVIAIFFGALGWPAVICGIVGIVLGALGRKNPAPAGTATAGLVMSIIAVAIALIWLIACASCASCVGCVL